MVTMRLVVACVCIIVGIVSIADGAPNAAVRDKIKEAQKLASEDDNEKALVIVEQGLAVAPKELELLQFGSEPYLISYRPPTPETVDQWTRGSI